MTNPFVVTINRQFGSGGREIGKRLAKTLDIAYLDKELLSLAAQKSGISEKAFEKADEKPERSYLYPLHHSVRQFYGAVQLSGCIDK